MDIGNIAFSAGVIDFMVTVKSKNARPSQVDMQSLISIVIQHFE